MSDSEDDPDRVNIRFALHGYVVPDVMGILAWIHPDKFTHVK